MKRYIQPCVRTKHIESAEMIASSGLYSTSRSADDSAILSNGSRDYDDDWDEE